MIWIQIASLFLIVSLNANDQWMQSNIYEKLEEAQKRSLEDKWFRETLRKKIEESGEYNVSKIKERTDAILSQTIKKPCGTVDQASDDYRLFVCMTFGLPDSLWIEYSNQLNEYEGTFVVRGLPKGSFVSFAKEVMRLRKMGINTPIQINPTLFEKCEIDFVPAIIQLQRKDYDKILGTVSIDYAIERFQSKK